MDERKKRVLNAIIEDYIANAEPVGSRAVAKKYGLGVSPATIRNEMSDLEEEGYIEQPHTSAGRVPSDKGYRFYVDNLMEKARPTEEEVKAIKDALSGSVVEFDEFLRGFCNVISRLTSYPSMIALPEQGRGKLVKLQMVPVHERQVLVIMLASTGILRHKIVDLPFDIDEGEIIRLEEELNRLALGMDMQELSYDFLQKKLYELGMRERILEQSVEVLRKLFHPQDGRKVIINGATNMLAHPEFRDIEKLKTLFELLETEGKVQKLLDAGGEENLSVAIGEELADSQIRDCSMVTANYFINGQRAGSIGVLGPTRMSYSHTVALLEYIAKELTAVLDKNKKEIE
ncbi:MAG: heat-inducible transcriptional repressor HrcA [Firmicutes bacterium]|nr:heat-inducible transcriptional repressor HrcA [Bacillota bacterium]